VLLSGISGNAPRVVGTQVSNLATIMFGHVFTHETHVAVPMLGFTESRDRVIGSLPNFAVGISGFGPIHVGDKAILQH